MLGLGLVLASASAAIAAPPSTAPAAPWWERITYTISGDGAQQSCRLESSLEASRACDEEGAPKVRGGSPGAYSKITVERRFSPGGRPDPVSLQSGDTLLGGQIIALAIGPDGAVQSCRIIGASGEVQPPYGCAEARAQRFEASARTEPAELRRAYMTIVVYGHEEYIA